MPKGEIIKAAGIALKSPDGKYLFVKRGDDSDHAGEWCFPGGKIEPSEDAKTAAIREVSEETGIDYDGELSLFNHDVSEDVDYTTYTGDISDTPDTKLCSENTDYTWASIDDLPEPLHPGVLKFMKKPSANVAMDRATVREKDRDGRLHVSLTNISKANICPYAAKEIPNWRELGLDPDKTYQMYRDPEELAKAAPSFNKVPVLSEHVPVDVDDYRPDLVIGATGSDAIFEAPYLKNSLVIWSGDAVNQIDNDDKKEISCAYYYTPDMTPGTIDGQSYDGVMRDIVANHVAIVVEGRAGPDVVVGDSKLEINPMPRATKGRKERVREAVIAYFNPKLATDATLDDLNLLLDKLDPPVKDDDMADEPAAIEPTVDDDDAVDPAMSPADKAKAFCQSVMTPEDFAKLDAIMGAGAETDPVDPAADDDLADGMADPLVGAMDDDAEDDDKKPFDKAAMDAAMRATEAATIKRMMAVRDAERAIKPYVGELAMSFDSAEKVYRHALTAMGVEVKGVHASALPAILKMVPKPSARPELVAQDGATVAKSFEERHPYAASVRF